MPASPSEDIISFGPFRLKVSERLLINDGARAELRGRAYDLLMALLSRPNEIISKSELLAQVWPGVVVEEGSLRLYMTNLRKALGDGSHGNRYIVNSSGRGYSLAAQVTRSAEQSVRPAGPKPFEHVNLPARPTMIDHEVEIEEIPAQLLATRFGDVDGQMPIAGPSKIFALESTGKFLRFRALTFQQLSTSIGKQLLD